MRLSIYSSRSLKRANALKKTQINCAHGQFENFKPTISAIFWFQPAQSQIISTIIVKKGGGKNPLLYYYRQKLIVTDVKKVIVCTKITRGFFCSTQLHFLCRHLWFTENCVLIFCGTLLRTNHFIHDPFSLTQRGYSQ